MPAATLGSWVHAHKKSGVGAFPGKSHLKPEDAEMVKLRRELAVTREERDILKNDLATF
jgi:transposase